MGKAEDILRRQGRMEAERSNFERMWEEIARLMLPRQADFLMGGDWASRITQGRDRSERVFDETAMQALDHGVSVFEGEVIPQGGQWQGLQAAEPELMNNLRVRQWFELKTTQLFNLRNSPRSGFAAQTHESVASLLSFGTQGMWPDILRAPDGRAIGLSYRSEHLGQLYFEEDYRGVVDTIHRKFTLSHRQALQMWPRNPPEAAAKGVRDGRGDDTATYLHVIEPNGDYQPGRADAKGKPYASCYVEMGTRELFAEGGYRSLPLIVSRYEKSPTETYGRSPAMNCLPAVRAAQAIVPDLITAIEYAARPMLGAHDDMLDQVIRYAPGGVTYGALDDRGNPLLRPIFESADLAPAFKLLEDTRAVIQRAFFMDLYIARQELKSHVSAREMIQREAEKGVLLAPLKRQETDWFTPLAQRELDLMAEMGLMDDMPEEVREAGGSYVITYENPLGRARLANEAGGFYDLLGALTPLMQIDQSLIGDFLERYPFEKVLPALGRIHGVPASWEASDEERQADKAAKAEAAQAQQLLEVGDRASLIARNLSQAEGALPNAA